MMQIEDLENDQQLSLQPHCVLFGVMESAVPLVAWPPD